MKSKSRFVKVEVIGGNASTAYPSLYEIEVFGWIIESDEYVIDFENKQIKILNSEENVQNLTTEKFLGNISFEGNMSYSLNSMSYFIQENDELVITDHSGNVTKFKCVFSDDLTSSNDKNKESPFQITKQGHELTVKSIDLVDSVKLEIRNLLGHTIVSEQFSDSYTCQLGSGLYLISLSTPQLNYKTVKYLIK